MNGRAVKNTAGITPLRQAGSNGRPGRAAPGTPPRKGTAQKEDARNGGSAGQSMPGRILVGDCLNLLGTLPPDSVDLTVTSPPYDDLRRYDTPAPLDLPALGRALLRVTRPGGVCAVVIQDASRRHAKSLSSFRLAVDWCDHAGWRLFECCLYVRHAAPGPWWRTRFRVDHEYVLIFLKGDRPRTFHKEALLVPTLHAGERVRRRPFARRGTPWGDPPPAVQPLQCRGTVWRYAASSAERNALKLTHPATMPDKLAGDLIRCFSDPGGLVLDPLMGSGTTVVMAARLGRAYVGMDASAAYARIARDRLAGEARAGGGVEGGRRGAERNQRTESTYP